MLKIILRLGFALAVCIAGRASIADAQTNLTIATWNIAWLNELNDTGIIKRKNPDYRRLTKYANRIQGDVIAVQEVDGEAAARRVFDPNLYDFHFESGSDPQRVGFVVRKGISVQRNPDYAALNVGGNLRKGVDITLTLGAKQLRLLAVHLKCCCPTGPITAGGQDCPRFRQQVPRLEEWIDARANEAIPFVVLGDFNRALGPSEQVWLEIDDGMPSNADLTGLVVGQSGKCWTSETPRRFIDHIVFDRRAAAWLVTGSAYQVRYENSDIAHKKRLSDHCPLRAKLQVQ